MSIPNFDSLLQRAKDAYFAHDYALSEKILEGCFKEEPQNIQVMSELAKVYVGAGKDAAALKFYKRILELDDKNFDAMNNLGSIYRRMGNYQDSVDILNRAFAVEASSLSVYYNIGQTYKAMGNYAEAENCFKKVLSINPEDVLANNHLGCIYAMSGNHEEALSVFRHALHIDPNHPILHFNSALSYEALGKTKEALESYENALRKKPGWIEAMRRFASLLEKCGRLEEAENILRKSVGLNYKNPDLHAALGISLVHQEKYDDAEKEFDIALKLDKNNFSAVSGKVALLEKQGKQDEACDLLLTLEKFLPNNVELAIQCAQLLMNMKKYTEASKSLRNVLDKEPSNPDALCLLGEYFTIKGEETKSQHCFEKGIKLKPENISYRFDAARHLHDDGNFEAAEVQMRFYLSGRPDDFNAWIYLGLLYTELDEIDNAVKVFWKAASINSSDPALLAAVTKLDKLHPDDPSVAELLQSILGNAGGDVGDLNNLEESLAAYEKSLNRVTDEDALERNLRQLASQMPAAAPQDEQSEADADAAEDEYENEENDDDLDEEELSLTDDGFNELREKTLDDDPEPVDFDESDEEIDLTDDTFEDLVLGSDDDVPLDINPNETKDMFDPAAPAGKKHDDILESEETLDLTGENTEELPVNEPPAEPQVPPPPPPYPPYPTEPWPQQPPRRPRPQRDYDDFEEEEELPPPKPKAKKPKPAPEPEIEQEEDEPFDMTPEPVEEKPLDVPSKKKEPIVEEEAEPEIELEPEEAILESEELSQEPESAGAAEESIAEEEAEPEIELEPEEAILESEELSQEPESAGAAEESIAEEEAEPEIELEPEEAILESEELSQEPEPKPAAEKTAADKKKEMQDAIRQSLDKLRGKAEESHGDPQDKIVNMLSYMRGLCNFLPQPKKTSFLASDKRMQLEYVINKLKGNPGLLCEANEVIKTVETFDDAQGTFVHRISEKAAAAESQVKPSPADISSTLLYMQVMTHNLPDQELAMALTSKIQNVLTRCDDEKKIF